MADEPQVATDQLEPATHRPGAWSAIAALLFVAIVVAVVFRPALNCGALIFDDNYYLTDNALVQHPSWHSAKVFAGEVLEPSTVAGYYQPLAMISLMLDCAMGASPSNLEPIQRTSFLLHVGNSVLVALLMLVMFRSVPAAVAAGLIFGLHPTAVETVPWIAQRKSLLATFFVLASMVAYVRYARRGGGGGYLLVAVFYLLALLSKPTSTPLPALLILLDWWPLDRLRVRTLLEKIPLFVIGGIFAIITVISQSRTGGASLPHDFGPLRIPMMLTHNIVFYLRQFICPVNLPGYYPFPEPFTPGNPVVMVGFIGTVLLLVGLVLSWRKTRAWVCGWLIMFVAIFPTLGVIGFTDTIAANRFLYLPMIGLLLPIAYVIQRGWRGASARTRRRHIAIAAVLFVVCGLEAFGTRRALAHWRTSLDYFAHVSQQSPRAAKVRYSYGEALDRAGKTEQAEQEYRAAIELKPDYAMAHNNLATILAARGDVAGAIEQYHRAIEADPSSFHAYNNLAVLLAQNGRTKEAIPLLEHAVELDDTYVDAHFNLGRLLGSAGRFDEAAAQFERARQLAPDDLDILYHLAVALDEAGRIPEAIEAYKEVLRRHPHSSGAKTAGVIPDYYDVNARMRAAKRKLDPRSGERRDAINRVMPP